MLDTHVGGEDPEISVGDLVRLGRVGSGWVGLGRVWLRWMGGRLSATGECYVGY